MLARAPRVAADVTGVIWADAHGFSAHGRAELALELLTMLERRGVADLRAGVADTPVAAQIAAMYGGTGRNSGAMRAPGQAHIPGLLSVNTADALTIVPTGADRAYVGLFPLDVLDPDPRLRPLLAGIGVSTCAELAALDRESLEVRLGPTAVPSWKLARADDPRLIFAPTPLETPHASLDWVEYALKDPARLLFVLNNLLERVCATLASAGEGARELTIEFALTDKGVHVEALRASRPTANRRTWFRLVRTRVERMKLRAAVTGIAVQATKVAGHEAPQGDLFDRGFATRRVTEDAVARLVDDQGEVVVVPENTAHPLLDERTTWVPQSPADATGAMAHIGPAGVPAAQPCLHLQIAPSPLAIVVETAPRRDHFAPVRYRDSGGWHELVSVAGPERVSGREWSGDRAYAREYFRCVTKEGAMVWLFRSADDPAARRRQRDGTKRIESVGIAEDASVAPGTGRWYLHGWWD